MLFECNPEMFRTQILCDFLQLIYTGNFQIAKILVKGNVTISVAGIDIVKLTVCVRIESQAKSVDLILEDVHEREVFLRCKETDRTNTDSALSPLLINVGNSDQLGD